jgi:hypothetical protein
MGNEAPEHRDARSGTVAHMAGPNYSLLDNPRGAMHTSEIESPTQVASMLLSACQCLSIHALASVRVGNRRGSLRRACCPCRPLSLGRAVLPMHQRGWRLSPILDR